MISRSVLEHASELFPFLWLVAVLFYVYRAFVHPLSCSQMLGHLHVVISRNIATDVKTYKSVPTLCSIFEGHLEMELPGHMAVLPLTLSGPDKLLSALVAQAMAILIFLRPHQFSLWFPLKHNSLLMGGK